jgi:DNA-binding XRE family transcriptional regulator
MGSCDGFAKVPTYLANLLSKAWMKSHSPAAIAGSTSIAAQCARQLLELRAQNGETQRQLAQRLGMTESMISRLERGDHMPSVKTLCRIAGAFGRRLEIVFHEHEHTHADGARHSHPHDHHDPDHDHRHEKTR